MNISTSERDSPETINISQYPKSYVSLSNTQDTIAEDDSTENRAYRKSAKKPYSTRKYGSSSQEARDERSSDPEDNSTAGYEQQTNYTSWGDWTQDGVSLEDPNASMQRLTMNEIYRPAQYSIHETAPVEPQPWESKFVLLPSSQFASASRYGKQVSVVSPQSNVQSSDYWGLAGLDPATESQATSSNSHYVAATGGDDDSLDESYQVRNKKFFRTGRVFSTLFPDPVSSATNNANIESESKDIHAQFAQKLHSKILRFIVVKPRPTSCICFRVISHDVSRLKKNGINLHDHGQIYSGYQAPRKPRELIKDALRVKLSREASSLSSCLVNYGEKYIIETDAKVKDVGELDTPSKKLLLKYFGEDAFDEDEKDDISDQTPRTEPLDVGAGVSAPTAAYPPVGYSQGAAAAGGYYSTSTTYEQRHIGEPWCVSLKLLLSFLELINNCLSYHRANQEPTNRKLPDSTPERSNSQLDKPEDYQILSRKIDESSKAVTEVDDDTSSLFDEPLRVNHGPSQSSNAILEVLTDQILGDQALLASLNMFSPPRPSDSFTVTYEVTWELPAYLSTFFHQDLPLSQILTLTGDIVDAQAASCHDYLEYNWPKLGSLLAEVVATLRKSLAVGLYFL
jgi:hypothetical protein